MMATSAKSLKDSSPTTLPKQEDVPLFEIRSNVLGYGHVFSADGLRPDRKKVEATQNATSTCPFTLVSQLHCAP